MNCLVFNMEMGKAETKDKYLIRYRGVRVAGFAPERH
jgi:hypothetical protein